jgi:hypothetical protein
MISRRFMSSIANAGGQTPDRALSVLTTTFLVLTPVTGVVLTHERNRMEYEKNVAEIEKTDWMSRGLSPEKYGKEKPYKHEFYTMDQLDRQRDWFKRGFVARTVFRPPGIQSFATWEAWQNYPD